jgi:hypothetical protein
MWAVVVAVAVTVAAHNRSEGSSRFVVGEHDVQIEVNMLKLDLPELCEVDLSVSDIVKRDAETVRLRQCVEGGMSRWLRLRSEGADEKDGADGADGACIVGPGDVRVGDDLSITLSTRASCPPLAGRTLVIDWGFFAGQRLDHVSRVSIVVGAPDGGEDGGHVDRALFSQRQRKLRVKVPAAGPPAIVVGAVVGGVGVMSAVAALWRRRRRRR